MALDVTLSVLFLVFLGFTILNGRWSRAGIGEAPLVYQSVLVQFFLNLAMLAFIGLSLFLLFFYSWRLLAILFAIAFVTESFFIVPSLERVLYFFVDRLERRAEKSLRQMLPIRDLSTLVEIPADQWVQAEIAAYPNDFTDLVVIQGLEAPLQSGQRPSRTVSPRPTREPSTMEKLDAAFRTPETARDLCLFLMETGQIPVDQKTPPTAEAFDQFFGAQPMSSEKRERFQAVQRRR